MTENGVCDFSIDGDSDGDSPSFFDTRIVKARKVHKCYECGEVIAVGAQYRRVTGKWDTKPETYSFCLPCEEAADEFFDDGRTFGVFWEEMQNNWAHGAHLQACLNRLTTATAKEHMRQQWMKWQESERQRTLTVRQIRLRGSTDSGKGQA